MYHTRTRNTKRADVVVVNIKIATRKIRGAGGGNAHSPGCFTLVTTDERTAAGLAGWLAGWHNIYRDHKRQNHKTTTTKIKNSSNRRDQAEQSRAPGAHTQQGLCTQRKTISLSLFFPVRKDRPLSRIEFSPSQPTPPPPCSAPLLVAARPHAEHAFDASLRHVIFA